MNEIRAALSRLQLGTLVLLGGPLIVARDVAHARLHDQLQAGRPLPAWFHEHPVYYAGPATVRRIQVRNFPAFILCDDKGGPS